jgi:hypothetical protein
MCSLYGVSLYYQFLFISILSQLRLRSRQGGDAPSIFNWQLREQLRLRSRQGGDAPSIFNWQLREQLRLWSRQGGSRPQQMLFYYDNCYYK